MAEEKREEKYRLWKKAVTRTFDWVDEPPRVEAKVAHRSREKARQDDSQNKEDYGCMGHYSGNSWGPWC